MSAAEFPSFLPVVAWLCAALLCLGLEAAGTPVGARKRGARPHLQWVIGLTGVGIVVAAALRWNTTVPADGVTFGVVADRVSLLMTGSIGAVVALVHIAARPGLRAMDEERGEMSAAHAIFGASASLLVVSTELAHVAAALVLAASAVGLLAAPDRDGPHGIEAAVKTVVGIGLVLVFVGLALALSLALGPPTAGVTWSGASSISLHISGIVVVALALLSGAVPFHQAVVDRTHGSAPSAAALFGAVLTLALGSVTIRFIDAGILTAAPIVSRTCSGLALLTLVGAPIAALDQARVGRVVAYQTLLPAGLIWAACGAALASPAAQHGTAAILLAALTGALAVVAAVLGVATPSLDAASTWEDWSGYGRRRPVMAALFVYALGSLAGVPGTVGFLARLDVSRAAFDAGLDAVGLCVVASAAVGAAPIVRLALFLFAKDEPPRLRARRFDAVESSALRVVFVVVVAAMVALAAWPPALDAIIRVSRP